MKTYNIYFPSKYSKNTPQRFTLFTGYNTIEEAKATAQIFDTQQIQWQEQETITMYDCDFIEIKGTSAKGTYLISEYMY